ncbi:MAG TPA: chemotaxis protein CheW, partial [Nevskiaceae bacterium]
WTGIALRVRARWILIPRTEVREILLRPRLTRVPGAKPFLIGVANLRGALLPVTDLGALWGEAVVPEHHRQRVVVLNSRHIPAGFLVDEVGGYRRFAPADQHHDRIHEVGVPSEWLLGAFARDAQTWPVLSLHRVVRSAAFVKAGG